MNDFVQLNSPPPPDLPAFEPAHASEPKISPSGGEKFLVFTLGAELFAVSTRMVIEAAASSALSLTALPNAPEWLCGVVNLRGGTVPVINLALILQKPAVAATPKAKFIVLRSRFFEFGAAFKADRINEIAVLSGAEIDFGCAEIFSPSSGQINFQSQKLTVIDSEEIFSKLLID